MNETLKLFKALSDQTRMRIYNMVSVKEMCVCEITSILNLAFSTISTHLKILKEAGLIEEKKDGKWVNYKKTESQNPIIGKIDEIMKLLSDELIESDRKSALLADRVIICGVEKKDIT
ncbi:MAG: winged helix-turn-helix transcriptional regulator [Candidatus Delongbacteria bacterium]|nr:winged helix-turn-helix transcriptional regulator [Candidatus Delongbacteria bacterium]MBN2836903.1 winged helix-turn-helix transcriptional regulator [Candidatus Delongbacteria bacterium]